MPKKPNYDFEKRRREQQRQAKKDAKLEEKARRREADRAAAQPADGVEPPPARDPDLDGQRDRQHRL